MAARSTAEPLLLAALLLAAGVASWSLVPREEGGPPAAPRASRRPGPTPAPGAALEPPAPTPGATVVAPASTETTPPAGATPRAAPALEGRVVDPAGLPVQGAELGPVLARTDAAGHFALEQVPPAGVLEVAAHGLARRVVRIAGRGPGPLLVTLGPARVVEGRVVAAEDPLRAIEGALVSGSSPTWSGRARSDADGRFRFPDVPMEETRLVVTADGRSTAVVEGGAPLALIALELGRTTQVRVAGPGGEAVQGPTVFLLEEDPCGAPRVHAATPDGAGRFVVTGLRRDARVAVVASAAADGAPVATPLPPPWQAPRDEVTGTLAAARTVELRGAPLSAPDLVLVSVSSILPPFPIDARTEGGVHRFEGVTPGPWQVRARTGEVAGATFEVPVGDPSTPVVIDGAALELPATRDP